MKRVCLVLMLSALLVGRLSPAHAQQVPPVAVESAPVDAKAFTSQALAVAAASPVKGEWRLGAPSAFATVYEVGGKRYAVLDYRTDDAPKGERVISGEWLRTYSLTHIDVVRASTTTQPPLATPDVPPTRTPETSKVGALTVNDPDNPWSWPTQLFERRTAYFNGWRSSYDLRDQYLRAGAYIGCENATTRTRNCPHETTVSWSWTTGGSTQLSAEKIVQIGFEYQRTHADSDRFTFTDIPPMTGLWDIPYVVADKVHFTSSRDEYVCGTGQGYWRCWTRWFYNATYSTVDHYWRYDGFVDRIVERPLGSPPS